MKVVRLENNKIVEIIPEYALPVSKWYGEEFASHCVEAPDEVEQGWMLKDGVFSIASYEPTLQEQISTLKNQLNSTDYKVVKCAECSLAGLPLPYDIVALNTERQLIRDQINTLEAQL